MDAVEETSKPRKPAPRLHQRIIRHSRRWGVHACRGAALVLVVYVGAAYVVLPAAWQRFMSHSTPPPAAVGNIAFNTLGLPSDPVNLALVGSREEILAALTQANWQQADAATVRTSVATIFSVLAGRDYPSAPMSALFLGGRLQDLSFQQANGSPASRHHVRLWLSDQKAADGRPVWLGAATYDTGISLCHFTGRLTHRIGQDVDAERDKVVADLMRTGGVAGLQSVRSAGPIVQGRNGSGDQYFTDGQLTVVTLRGK